MDGVMEVITGRAWRISSALLPRRASPVLGSATWLRDTASRACKGVGFVPGAVGYGLTGRG
jgi:hypothetical protein